MGSFTLCLWFLPVTIDWVYFPIGLLLLWFPRVWLRRGPQVVKPGRASRQRRQQEEARARDIGDRSVRFKVEFTKLRNYVDFLRAAVGGLAIMGGAMLLGDETSLPSSILAAPDAPLATANAVLWLRLSILLVGVIIHSLRFEGRVTLFPPIFYLSGLVLGLCGLYAMLFAIVLIWTVNLALRSPMSFLSFYALLVGVFGCLFQGLRPEPLFAMGLVFLPVLLSLLMRRPLVLFAKKIKSHGALSSA